MRAAVALVRGVMPSTPPAETCKTSFRQPYVHGYCLLGNFSLQKPRGMGEEERERGEGGVGNVDDDVKTSA